MKNDSLFCSKSIGYFHDPGAPGAFNTKPAFDNDLILFSVSSESFRNISLDRISVIGGRSANGYSVPGKRFSDIINIPDSEKDLFIDSLYNISEKAAVIPLKNKILVIYNQLLRSNGLGIALIFDRSPKCVSALLHSEAINFSNVLFSSSFSSMTDKDDGAMEFLSSFSRFLDKLKHSDTLSRFNPKSDIKTILNVINSASDLMGCPISVELQALPDGDLFLDRPTLMAFSLCLLSQARRLSKERKATVKISAKELFNISVDFVLYSKANIDKIISETGFCDKMAQEMGIPFGLELNGGICSTSFIPYRADPSLLGFKAGIFINGKRIIRRP